MSCHVRKAKRRDIKKIFWTRKRVHFQLSCVVNCRYSVLYMYIVGQYIIKVAWLNAFARKKRDPVAFFLWQVGVMAMLSHFYKTFYNMQYNYLFCCYSYKRYSTFVQAFFMITSFIIRKAGRRSRKAYCRCNGFVMLVVVVCHNDRLSSLDLLNDHHHDHRHLPKRWSVVEAAIDRCSVKSPKPAKFYYRCCSVCLFIVVSNNHNHNKNKPAVFSLKNADTHTHSLDT